jgi:2'-5' RNA ligase
LSRYGGPSGADGAAGYPAPVVQSVELLLDPALDGRTREQWAALAVAGLPSQAGHRDSSNRPHITVGVAQAIGPVVERRLADLVDALPVVCELGDPLVFGGRRQILVRAVRVTDGLRALHGRVATVLEPCPGVPDTMRPAAWTPHVTLARRLTAEQTEAALGLLDFTTVRGAAVALRRWDGDARREWRLG